MLRLLLSALLLATTCAVSGCERAPTPGPLPTSTCERDVAALQAWIDQLVAEGVPYIITPGPRDRFVRLPEREPWTVPVERMPVVDLGAESLAFNNEFMESRDLVVAGGAGALDSFRARTRQERALQCEHAPDTPAQVLLNVDRDMPWKPLRRVIDTLYHSGYDRVMFVFEVASKVTPPAPDPRLDKLISYYDTPDDPSQPARSLDWPRSDPNRPQHPMDAALGACPQALATIQKYGPIEKGFSRLPDALRACECAARPEDVKPLIWWWAERRYNAAYTVGLAVTLAGESEGAPVAVSDDTPWSSAYRAVAEAASKPGAGPLRLRARVAPADEPPPPKELRYVCKPSATQP